VHHLGSDQPVYGLQAQGLDGKQAPYSRVEEMAAHYIQEIRSVQPEGPYQVGGSGLGARIAFEIAQQLHAQGQQVTPIIFDAKPPRPGSPAPVQANAQEQVTNSFTNWPPSDQVHHTRRLIRLVRRRHLTRVLPFRSRKKLSKRLKSKELRSPQDQVQNQVLERVRAANNRADYAYVGQLYPGRVTLFLCSETYLRYQDRPLQWSQLAAGGVDLHVVPGGHHTWDKEPLVQAVAEELRTCLDAAQSEVEAQSQAELAGIRGEVLMHSVQGSSTTASPPKQMVRFVKGILSFVKAILTFGA
jgi:thioesterase domain-containing protein